jgi:radical SAM protein with 4Fe4S-binding SPASM domain
MLHPQFFSFLEIAGSTKTTVSTNGHFLTVENAQKLMNSGLHKLIVSLDGMDQETYSKYRKDGDLRKVMQGIKNVSEAKRKVRSSVKLEIQFLVNRYNESQIPAAKQFAHETGAKLNLKSMQIINNEHIEQWLPGNEKFRRYKKDNGNYFIKSRLRNNCLRLWLNPVIIWSGKVVPCCFDKDADHVMGDLNESSFRDIWYGEKYRAFRESVFTERKKIKICKNCTSGLRGVVY